MLFPFFYGFFPLALINAAFIYIGKMASLEFLLLGFFYMASYVNGFGGWTTAHATFYGGGDASGTMGMYSCINAIWISLFERIYWYKA